MSVNMAWIQSGMEVFDTNGEKVGTVDDVLAVEARSATEVSSGVTTAPGPFDPHPAHSGGYLKVVSGGFLGIGGHDLYVPFSAVSNVAPGDCVTINCTRGMCSQEYSAVPEALDSPS